MSVFAALLPGLVLGVLFSIPPGAAGVIIVHLSLRGAREQAARALGAFLVAEMLVMGVGLMFFGSLAGIAAFPGTKLLAGAYLMGFAVMAWRAAGTERGFAATSSFAVFKITLLNPAIWIGAISMLTLAGESGGPGLVPRLLFVGGLELGSFAWYLFVILGARHVPDAWRRHIERGAVVVIGATGAWFAGSIFL